MREECLSPILGAGGHLTVWCIEFNLEVDVYDCFGSSRDKAKRTIPIVPILANEGNVSVAATFPIKQGPNGAFDKGRR